MSGGFCVCPPDVTRRECIAVRYGVSDDSAINDGETCECACHDADDRESQDFYASQLSDSTQDNGPYALPEEFPNDNDESDFTERDVIS